MSKDDYVTTWEYEIIVRGRNLTYTGAGVGGTFQPLDFDPAGDEMKDRINQMGREGWELVNVFTRQSQHNSPLTTEEIWVLKRPIS